MGLKDIEGTLRKMLNGDLDLVEGCRILVRHRGDLEQIAPNEFAVIAGVESETDDLPLGKQRAHWSSGALEQKDRERQMYLQSVRETLLAACREVLGKVTT